MLRSTKILIHDERSDSPEFLLELLAHRGYKAGFAKNPAEITAMLLNGQYNVVLTNGKYHTLNTDHHAWLKSSSVFIIGITVSHTQAQDLRADVYLQRPFLISELWQALETQHQLCEK
jgi:DNA-binding response OmpR family regulator